MIPLDLYAEVETADGTRYRWDANQAPGSRPLNLSFRTKIGEGFSDASLQLARRIDQDYPDLNLVDTVRLVGADGTLAYEGRVSEMPRDLSDHHSIGVTLTGWMANAKERKFQTIITDRNVNQFGVAPLERQAALLTGAISLGDFSFTNEQGGLVCALPNQQLGAQTVTEAWYEAPPGTAIGTVYYQGTSNSFPAGWTVRLGATDDRASGTVDTYTPTLDNTLRSIPLTTSRRYIYWQVYSNATASLPAAGSNVRFTKLAVYADHGITLRTGDPAEPPGTWISDTLKYIAQRWCPQLNTSGVQENSYVVQHLAPAGLTYPFDAFLELNKYALWHLGVWDDRTLVYKPYDLSDYDWEIRTDDQGTTFSPQGPSTDSLFNGVTVTYVDPLTGGTDTLTPDAYTQLADASAANPWNTHGVDHWDDIALSSPALLDSALLLGTAALADRNRPKTPGTITVTGYVRDRGGNLQPAHKIRAGDTIAVTNFPNDEPRLIVETDYDDETHQMRLAVDKPFALLDAYLDRVGNALQAAGLA